MTTNTDTYNYAQNPLGGGKYTTVTVAGLQSTVSGAKGTSAVTQDNVSMWAVANHTCGSVQTSALVHGTLGNFDWVGVGLYLSTTGGGQGYILYLRPEATGASLFKLTAGTVGAGSNFIGNWGGLTLTPGNTLELDTNGSGLFTAKYAGVTLGTVTDTTYGSGQYGLAYQDGNVNASLITSWIGTDSGGSIIVQPRLTLLGAG